jgi:hypothetical protein
MFANLNTRNKRTVMPEFAPMALYLQEVTGYPASVIMSHMVKEKGWDFSSSTTALFGVKGRREESVNFTVSNGLTMTVDFNGRSGNWQGYASRQDTFLGYIYLVLYEDNGYYGGIRRQIPTQFPPPANRDNVIDAIARSGYCASGCGDYGGTMRNILRNSCAAPLDNIILCDYNYPILNGLPPLHRNIQPSSTAGRGSAEFLRYSSSSQTTAPAAVEQ